MKAETRNELNRLATLRYGLEEGNGFYSFIGELLIAVMNELESVNPTAAHVMQDGFMIKGFVGDGLLPPRRCMFQHNIKITPKITIVDGKCVDEFLSEYDKQLKKVQQSYQAKRERDLDSFINKSFIVSDEQLVEANRKLDEQIACWDKQND